MIARFMRFQTHTRTHDDNNIKNKLNEQQRRATKKCHGNRRDQRFRRKCRASGMKPKTIENLIKKESNKYH